MNKSKVGEGRRNWKKILENSMFVRVWITSERWKAVKAGKAGEELAVWPGHLRPRLSSR